MSIPSWLTTDSRRKELPKGGWGVHGYVAKNGHIRIGSAGAIMPVSMVMCETGHIYRPDTIDGFEANSIKEMRELAYSIVNDREENSRLIDEVLFGVDSDAVVSMDVVTSATDHMVANILNWISHED